MSTVKRAVKKAVQVEMPYTLRVSKLMADELRMKIVMELNLRMMSPKEFFDEFGGGSLSRVCRAFEQLEKFGWLELVETKTGGKRRGGVEHFYRATKPAVFYDDAWAPLPRSLKEMISGGVFGEIVKRVRQALHARTIDARADRHISWFPLLLDAEGWKNVIAKIDALFHWIFEEQERAKARMQETGEEPIPMTVALLGFESPKETEKQP